MPHQPMEDLEVFRIFEEVSDWCWEQVSKWRQFERDTLGKQLVRAVNSVNANLVEGDGRYTTADSVHFFRIARASAREARLWLRRAGKRKLVDEVEVMARIEDLTKGTRLLNLLIKYRVERPTKNVKEEIARYGSLEAENPFLGKDNPIDPFAY